VTQGSDPTIDMGTSAPTAVLPSTTDRRSRSRIVGLTFLVVAAAAFLLGIAIASTVHETPPGVVVASQNAGPSGATIRFDGGEIRVPAGAVSSPTRIVVRRTVIAERVQVRPPTGPVRTFAPRELVAYVFEPKDVTFLRPVTLIFRLHEAPGGATAFARVGDTTVLLGGTVDADRETLIIEASDFRFTQSRPVGADR
jgi:hypothetical protein